MQGGRDWIGGMEYIRNIILALASLPQETRATFEVSLLADSLTDKNFIKSVQHYLKDVNIVEVDVRSSIFYRIKRVIIAHILTSSFYGWVKILKKNNFDFVYPINSYDNEFRLKNTAAWIYDFQHKYLPEYFTENEIRNRNREFALIAHKAPIVVLSSKSAETDFRKFYPHASCTTKVLPFKIISQPQWYEADSKEIQRKYCLPDKYFIISNQFWQHKNHLTVFYALKLLKDSGIEPVVVCTGHIYDYRRPDYSDLILQTIHTSGLSRQIYLLGLIPKNDQIQLVRRSIALIQPSLFEGWSTVVEDARCLGKPLILSDLPVHREQNPPDSRFFDGKSASSLAPVMADYWESLSPGPHFEQESIAREYNVKEVIEFANSFLQIAQLQKLQTKRTENS